jgi:hypothetical protein
MRWLRPLLLAAAVLLGPAPTAAAPRATTPAEPVMAAAFLDTIGVNLDTGGEAALARAAGAARQLAAAGIRHVRVRPAADAADPSWSAVRALTGAGLGVDLVAGPGTDLAGFAGAAAGLGAGLEALEAEGAALKRVPLLGPAGVGRTEDVITITRHPLSPH